MSTLSDLQAAHGKLQSMAGDPGLDPIELTVAINAALAPPAPSGSPSDVRSQAQAYRSAAQGCATASADIGRVTDSALPTAWKGQAAENAAQAIKALASEISTTEAALGKAADTLESWAEDLTWAQQQDHDGRSQLVQAGTMLSGYDMTSGEPEQKALPIALSGAAARVAGAQHLANTAPGTATLLNQYAEGARAQEITTGDMDPLSAVVLANASDSIGGDILSPTALALASQRLNSMSAADQAAFERLLTNAKSPQEAAYIWKALAAGNSLSQVESFDAAIHTHGTDLLWLAEHLTPDLNDPNTTGSGADWAAFKGQQDGGLDVQGWDLFDQGNVGDCVAASTVVAQASVDPVLMLSLTTGYGEPAGSQPPPGDDSAAALHQRLQQIYLKQYGAGQHADGFWANLFGHGEGIESKGENYLANQDLSGAAGGAYHYQGLSSAADRQSALPQIQTAVDSGKPVPFDVTGAGGGHQMLIIAHNGSNLEVYNPWGFTEWVSENQFVNGQLGALTGPGVGGSATSEMPAPDGVELPS
ncbi:MAG TPA: hypothetical protein VGM10_05580 [Actinocrinis sp.]|jgi:uncharacterized protein YukE